jgi:HK97 family phage major capsid protein
MRAVELTRFAVGDQSNQQAHIADLLRNEDSALAREVGLRVMLTGSPTYKRAWSKSIAGKSLDSAETDALNRAASLTTTAGGFAVPYDLDSTVILTSNGVVNPMRALARVITTTVDTWQGISSAGLAATYGYTTEAAEAGDNAPTIAQPSISTERAQAFVPFSIEIGMDWASFQSEMALLFQDAKDTVEGTAFITGSGTNAPQGVLTGGTAFINTAGTAAFVVADLYSLEEALPPRYRPRAQFIANRFAYNKVRQFDTGGGASLWIYLAAGLNNTAGGNTGAQLIGYPASEASNMTASLATGSTIAAIGDFKNGYVIVDRVGMSVELIPHLFATANNRPSGSRGLFAFWRNGAGVVNWNAIRRLVTL